MEIVLEYPNGKEHHINSSNPTCKDLGIGIFKIPKKNLNVGFLFLKQSNREKKFVKVLSLYWQSFRHESIQSF